MNTTIKLVLPDMTCGHCERTVTQAVHGVDPAAEVAIDLATHEVRIDSTRPAEVFKAVLADEGYPAAEPQQ